MIRVKARRAGVPRASTRPVVCRVPSPTRMKNATGPGSVRAQPDYTGTSAAVPWPCEETQVSKSIRDTFREKTQRIPQEKMRPLMLATQVVSVFGLWASPRALPVTSMAALRGGSNAITSMATTVAENPLLEQSGLPRFVSCHCDTIFPLRILCLAHR